MILAIAAASSFVIVLSNVLFWPRVRRGNSGAVLGSGISVLVPARNEEHNIGTCLEAILQQGSIVSEVLVYNDHSTDNTAPIVHSFSARDARVRVLNPVPLPPDWGGKNFACAQLALAARGGWLLFLDADAQIAPGAARDIFDEANRRNLTMLSCWPGFDLRNFSERVLMPMLNFVVFTIFPAVLSLRRREPSLGIAHGSCLFFERRTYEKFGGHGAVRDEIFEDTRLAQHWRRSGGRALCLDGQTVVRVRMYASFPEIWRGFQKNFFPAFRHEFMFWLFLAFHFAVFLLAFVLGNWIAIALILLSRLALSLRFAQPWWSVLAHPFAEFLILALGISSWWQCRTGRGVAWKGRQYRARRA